MVNPPHHCSDPSCLLEQLDLNENSRKGFAAQRVPSVIFPHDFPTPATAIWSQISPAVKKSRDGAKQAKMEWKIGDNKDESLELAAKDLVNRSSRNLFSLNDKEKTILHTDLKASMSSFCDFWDENLLSVRGFKVKLAAHWGPSAARCPSWHQDCVSARWIQTLCGPGTEHVDPLSSINNPYLDRVANPNKEAEIANGNDRHDWKERIIEESGVKYQQVPGGLPVILVGRHWPEVAKNDARAAVIHRFPHGFSKRQGRVVLDMDAIH